MSSKGNEYFCEVEDDYILDRFNLTGLNNEVTNYSQALELITDNLGASLVAGYFGYATKLNRMVKMTKSKTNSAAPSTSRLVYSMA